MPLLVFAAVLRRRLAEAAGWLGDLAFAGGLVLAAARGGRVMISLGSPSIPTSTRPRPSAILVDVQRFFAPLATGAVFALALAVALASLRHGALPAWVGAASLFTRPTRCSRASPSSAATPAGLRPGESVNLVGTLAFLPWAIAVGAGLARPYPRGDAPEGPRQAD